MISSPPALQLYTLREQVAAGRKDVLRRVADFGYGAVEPYDVLTDPEQLRADLDEAGLTACSVHARILGEDRDAIVRGARALGADTVIVPWADPERFADSGAVAALAAELNQAAARAADEGLRVGYHNHDFELSSIVGGRPALEVLADALDPAVILEVDTYWAAVGGQDVPALLGRLGDRVRYLHVKDGPIGTREGDMMTAVGSGRMPVADVLAACPSAEWHVVELDRCATDMLTAVGDSLAWLTKHDLAKPVQRG
ncbi:MAG TPA: sugar phosphate isomerase/epimerase [Trebonia sp.]|nr:sugar phosphate isomerase/epimerase [Trebonia sp.]